MAFNILLFIEYKLFNYNKNVRKSTTFLYDKNKFNFIINYLISVIVHIRLNNLACKVASVY